MFPPPLSLCQRRRVSEHRDFALLMTFLTQATALHWLGHMPLCTVFAYNSTVCNGQTNSFRVWIKCFNFCPAEESVWGTAASPHGLIVLCPAEEMEAGCFDALWSKM